MLYNPRMHRLGAVKNIMREITAYGQRRAAEIGAENVLDFSMGSPNAPVPAQVDDTIRAVLDSPLAATVHGYTAAQGDNGVRAALAESHCRRFNTKVSAQDFYLTVGAAAALCSCLSGLTVEGDEFICVVPYFAEYSVFIESAGAKVVEVPATPVTFDLDIDAIEKAITPHTKGVLINSPNNPTGVIYSAETLTALGEMLRRASEKKGEPIFLITDEPYRELVFDGIEVPWVPSFYDNTIVCYSYSKCLSLAGERIGYVLVPPTVTDHDGVYAAVAGGGRSLGYINAPSLFQYVIAACDGLNADLTTYRTNRDLLYENLTAMGFTCVKPQGTFYLIMKSPDPDAVAFSREAMARDLLFPPTDTFGLPGYVRIAFCVSTDRVHRALPVFRALAEKYGLCK